MEIRKDYLIEVCLMGQAEQCCRYIIADPEDGIVCGRDRPDIKRTLDARVDKMTAKGDNCNGWDIYLRNLDS